MVQIQKLLDESKRDWELLSWQGTFEQYLSMVIARPDLARSSHARLYDMTQWAGTAPGPEGVTQYNLFAGEIFGLDRALDRLVQFAHAAATGMEVRKRILLLMGPPASGKSSIVNLIKAGLERYTRSDEGAIYAIKGCPMHEDPLHLIPEERRQGIAREHGLSIEGDLCPRCRYSLHHEFGGAIGKVQVQRITLSQSAGVGMGSFVATAAHAQDISRLIGTVDPSCFGGDRLEGAGKGLRLDGELEAANRGIMEFIEIFKSDERFLAVVLGVTQEQIIKLGSFGTVSADEVIIGHSNEEEYNAFVNNKETAAFLDRLIFVKIPYNLRVSEEAKIYAKMLPAGHSQSSDKSRDATKIAPLSLHVAAALSVLSRLEIPERGGVLPRVTPLDRLRLYDGRILPPYTRDDVERLHEESPREGMFGLSPRYIINRLADVLTRERGCLTPAKALKSLAEGLVERAGIGDEERERTFVRVQDAVKEYKDLAIREVQRAAVKDFKGRANQLFRSFMRDVEVHFRGRKLGSASTTPPDEKLLRRVEGALNLRDADRPRFRQEVWQTYRYLRERPEAPGLEYQSIPMPKLAIENILFPTREEMRLTIDPGRKEPQRRRVRDAICKRLISEYGYCEECAEDLLHFAWRTLQGREVIQVRRGKVSWE